MDASKIFSSPATVLIGDVGGDYTNVGYTRGGVNITKSRDTRPIEADQSMYPLHIAITSEGYEIDLRLLETTYANLQLGWGEPGGSPATLSGAKLGMSSGASPAYKKIKIYGNRKDGTQVSWEFPKCMQTGFGAWTSSKDDEALIEFTLTALWDDAEGCIGAFCPATG